MALLHDWTNFDLTKLLPVEHIFLMPSSCLALILRDGPLENLWGGEGEVQKRYSRKAKLNEKKIHARHITLKNIHATA